MNWDDVDAFCRVIEHGGFSEAARAMNRPKSSISAAVARLESHLNARLLDRTTRRVAPTEAGTSLFLEVGPPFHRLREVQIEAMGLGSTVAGTLRIAAPYEFGAHHIGAVACELLKIHPQLRIDVEVEHAHVDPMDRRFDIVFSMVEEDMPDSRTVARHVLSLERGLYAAPDWLARHRNFISPRDFIGLPVIAALTDTRWAFVGPEGAKASVEILPRMRSSNADVRRQAAVAGLGVARITATFCAEAVREGLLVKVLPDWKCTPWRVYALLPGRRLMPPKARVFLDALCATAA